MNIDVQVSEFLLLYILGLCLKVELLGHVVIPCLTFGRTTKLFFIVVLPFYIPASNAQFPQILITLVNFCLSFIYIVAIPMAVNWYLICLFYVYNSHPNGCELWF